MKKWFRLFNLIVLSVLSLAVFYFIVSNYYSFEPDDREDDCIEVGLGSDFSYESCYDAYTKTIFFGVKRGFDPYEINSMRVSFFDFSERFYDVEEIPEAGGEEIYKILAEKNPKNIEVFLKVSGKNVQRVCSEPRKVFVSYCPDRGKDIEASLNPLKTVNKSGFVEVGNFSFIDSDILSLSLVDRERIWGSNCNSDWDCSEWEACYNGVQKRDCRDLKNCAVPTSIPENTRYCGEGCKESWECEWSSCSGGFTVPSCKDLNNCGTSYNIPMKIKCVSDGKCVPNIRCGEWTECGLDYDFVFLNNDQLANMSGEKTRLCEDRNSCTATVEESARCSLSIDIYTKIFKKCGIEFIGIYNNLDDSLIARIDKGTSSQPHLNINLDDGEESRYCDYCFDSVLNGDEEGVDCGGGCMPCDEKY
ncbi:MAG: hypothetical protein WC548_04290 [Candidatus Pacearchaeota archaeon]